MADAPSQPQVVREFIPLDRLDPAPWNPKTPIGGEHKRGLEASLDHFGVRDDLKVWPNPEEPGRYFVINGNQRLGILKDKGVEAVECRVEADLTEDDARLFTASFDRNFAFYSTSKLESLTASIKSVSDELKAKLLRPEQAFIPNPDDKPQVETPKIDMGPTIPMMFSVTREGYDEIKDSIVKIKQRMHRENRLKAALSQLSERESDDLVVEIALRIAEP